MTKRVFQAEARAGRKMKHKTLNCKYYKEEASADGWGGAKKPSRASYMPIHSYVAIFRYTFCWTL